MTNYGYTEHGPDRFFYDEPKDHTGKRRAKAIDGSGVAFVFGLIFGFAVAVATIVAVSQPTDAQPQHGADSIAY
jgi:hypothetical protein